MISAQDGGSPRRTSRPRNKYKSHVTFSAIKRHLRRIKSQPAFKLGQRHSVKRKATQTAWQVGSAESRKQKRRFMHHIARQGGVKAQWENWYDNIRCQICDRGDQEDKMLLCDGCDCGYHMHCISPILVSYPKGKWFCNGCRPSIVQKPPPSFDEEAKGFKQNQASIFEYFRILPRVGSDITKGVKKFSNAHAAKHRQCFRVAVPIKDANKRLMELASFAAAMKASGMTYQEDLSYKSRRARRLNVAKYDTSGVKELSKFNRLAVDKMKEMWLKGQCPPIVIKRCPREGLAVFADAPMLDRTLICEYVGEVGILKDHITDPHDSLMDLVHTENPDTSLVITPEKRGNIARFLSGVNNTKEDSVSKINVRSARFSIDGVVRVFLYCCRKVAAGDKLCYDYNGFRSGYPTEHFT